MDTDDNKRYRISVKALVLNETRDKFLVVLEETGRWDLLGGGLEYGEAPEECLRREIEKEEMQVRVLSVAPTPCYFFTGVFLNPERRGQRYANVVYEVALESLNFVPSRECEAVRFVSPAEVPGLQVFDSVENLALQFRKEYHAAP
jgi:8-oxo-dGTP diphosphatase